MKINFTHVADNDYAELENGEYFCTIEKLNFMPTKKDPNNFMLAVQYKVANGLYEGRMIFENLVLVHPSQDIIKYSLVALKSIVSCVGRMDLIGKDAEIEIADVMQAIIHKPIIIKLGLNKKGEQRILARKAVSNTVSVGGVVVDTKTVPF